LSGWLLDTNVLSELRRPRRDPNVLSWIAAQPDSDLFVSRITLAELRYGIEILPPDDARRGVLETWLTQTIRPWFARRILEVDEDVILGWRRMVRTARERGYAPTVPDIFIAATAALHGLCVVTRNAADFAQFGVPVLNPWNPA
jgi:predicted nucleic acid-binding protein